MKIAPSTAGRLSPADLQRNRDRLLHAVSAVIEVSTDAAIRASGGCKYHQRLVAELKPTDTLISFNYDCVLDHALRKHADGKWSAKYGYTFPNPSRIERFEAWNPPNTGSLVKEDRLSTQTAPVSTDNAVCPTSRSSRRYGTRQLLTTRSSRLYGRTPKERFASVPDCSCWVLVCTDRPAGRVVVPGGACGADNTTEEFGSREQIR